MERSKYGQEKKVGMAALSWQTNLLPLQET